GGVSHDHEGALHERVPGSAQFNTLNCKVAGRDWIEPDDVSASRYRVRLNIVDDDSEVVKDICTRHASTDILAHAYTKDVIRIVRQCSITVGELPVKLMGGYFDCAALADLLRRRKEAVDGSKASYD